MDSVHTNPSSVADLIGQSVRVGRDNARSFFKILLWPTLLDWLGKAIALVGADALIEAAQGKNLFIIFGGLFACGSGAIICQVAAFFLTLRQLALVRLHTGYDTSFEDAYKFVGKKKLAVFGTLLGTGLLFLICFIVLAVIIFVVGAAVLLVVGKARPVIAVVTFVGSLILIVLSASLSVAPLVLLGPALALETRPLLQLISRTTQLAFNNLLRTTYFLTLLAIVLYALCMALNIPEMILSLSVNGASYLRPYISAPPPNLLAQLLGTAWNSAVNVVLTPVAFLACGFYYQDLRMRLEGYDISRRLTLISSREKSLVLMSDVSDQSFTQ